MFIDYAKMQIKSGKGGDGSMSFRREKFVAHGGPDGGCGGEGGNVIAVGRSNITTLLNFKYKKHFTAENGKNGEGSNKYGKKGEDVILEFPLGTEIYELDEEGNRLRKLADIAEESKKIVLAKGGRGGRGNAVFASSTNQAPRRHEDGEIGETKDIEVTLKLMADAGLVGFPNAGKSTLISHMSAAHPKVANYEFTTLQPCIGVVKVDEIHTFVMADIPGIIEGAHQGKGLGIQFLKHIERNKVLVFVLDITQPDLFGRFQILKTELHSYKTDLDRKKFIILLNKIDLIPKEDLAEWVEEIEKEFSGISAEVLPVSAVTGKNLQALKYKIYELIKDAIELD